MLRMVLYVEMISFDASSQEKKQEQSKQEPAHKQDRKRAWQRKES